MLRTWLHRLTAVRQEEAVPLLLMVSYGFLAMTSCYLVRPARTSVFVERVGTENLPWVYVVTTGLWHDESPTVPEAEPGPDLDLGAAAQEREGGPR